MSDEAIKAADALGAAMRARDAKAIAAIYADDAAIWHASTGQTQTRAENVGMLGGLFAITSSLEYVDIRRHPIEGGVVQQHRLIGAFDHGRALPDLHACMIIRVRNGLVVSIEEYFDAATYAEVWERLGALAEAN